MGVEDMYWTHFQTVRFGVHLSGNFTSQLIIPKKFSEKVRKRFPEKLSLRGPAGESHNWEVELSTNNNTTSLVGESWKEFVTTYGLKENDFLVFKYKNNSYFKVLIFDAQSSWVEKESSYFVVKTDTPRSDYGEETKQEKVAKPREETPPQVFTDKNEESDQIPRRGDSRERESLHNMSTEVAEDSDEEVEVVKRKKDDFEWKPVKKVREDNRNISDTPESIRGLASSKALDWPKDGIETRQVDIGSSSHYSTRKQANPRRKSPTASYNYLTQKRGILGRKREPTDMEKERAKQLAFQELSEDSFLIVMSPSHVDKTFRLALPKAWTEKFMSACNQDVMLRLGDEDKSEWRTMRYNYDRNRCLGQIIGGWNHFARDNALRESDVCVFKLAGRKQGNVCMDVKIFRVTEVGSDHSLAINQTSDQAQEKSSTSDVVVGLKSMKRNL